MIAVSTLAVSTFAAAFVLQSPTLSARAAATPSVAAALVLPLPAQPSDAQPSDAQPSDAQPSDAQHAASDPTSSPTENGDDRAVQRPDKSDTLAFADHLFLDGDWYRAITEYRRYLWQVRGRGADAERAAMAIGEALARGEQWDAAGRQLDGVAQRAGSVTVRDAALFAAARVYLLDGRPELAKPRFRLLVSAPTPDGALLAESQWLLAWGHLDAGEVETARELFASIVNAQAARSADAAAVVDAIDTRHQLAWKDPLLAGVLSLVPGLGHVYLGQWTVGMTSLVWNGLFLFAAISSWIAGDVGVAVVLTLFELGWYSGGIFGAVAGAFRHNRDAVRNWRDELLAAHGSSRELPDMMDVRSAPPGTLLRFGGTW